MEARGPEALLLSARLAEHRATRLYAGLEMPNESSMYVEFCVQSQRPRPAGLPRAASRRGVWARFSAALHRAAGRPSQVGRTTPEAALPWMPSTAAWTRAELVHAISAAGAGGLQPVQPASDPDVPYLSLAFQPLLRLDQESA